MTIIDVDLVVMARFLRDSAPAWRGHGWYGWYNTRNDPDIWLPREIGTGTVQLVALDTNTVEDPASEFREWSDIMLVFRWDRPDADPVYLRKIGRYDSFGCSDWSKFELTEVLPWEKTVIRYATTREWEASEAAESRVRSQREEATAAYLENKRREALPEYLDPRAVEVLLAAMDDEDDEDVEERSREPYWGNLAWEFSSEPRAVPGLGDVTSVTFHGGEGQGDYAEVVLKVVFLDGVCRATEAYYRKQGSYASFDGFYWDGDFERVEPRQKTITVYEKTPSTEG